MLSQRHTGKRSKGYSMHSSAKARSEESSSCWHRGIFEPGHLVTPDAHWRCIEDCSINWRLAGSQMDGGTKKWLTIAYFLLIYILRAWRSPGDRGVRQVSASVVWHPVGLPFVGRSFTTAYDAVSGGISEKEGRLR